MSPTEQRSNYDRIVAKLFDVRSRTERSKFVWTIARGATGVLAVSLSVVSAEAAFHMGVDARTVLATLVGGAIVAAIISSIAPPALRFLGIRPREEIDDVAGKVGAHFPQIRDRLLNALQVVREYNMDHHPKYSFALVDAAFQDIAVHVESLDLGPVVDRRPAARATRIALIMCAISCVAAVLLPTTLYTAADRILHFRTDFAPPAPFVFQVYPGDQEVVKGDRIVITASTSLPKQPEINLNVREEQQSDFDAVKTQRDSTGRTVYSIDGIRSTLVYYAEAEGYRSRMFTIRVVDRPIIRTMRVRLDFPRYTKLPPKYLDDNTGDIDALTGTVASWELSVNKKLARARLAFSDSQSTPLALNGTSARTTLHLFKDRSYHFELTDTDGIRNADPITYTIKLAPDLAPTIQILDPAPNVDLDESMRVPMNVHISDDYGFSRLVLHYRLTASKYEQPKLTYSTIPVSLPSIQKPELDVPYIWNLSSLGLVPEDVIEYYFEVFDNDAVTGPKSACSRKQTLRLPSMEEVFTMADHTQQQATDDLSKTLDAAQDIQKQLQDLQREMKQQQGEKLDWQQKKTLEEALKRQEKMLEDVRQVTDQMQQLSQDLQQQKLISDETMSKYQELQNLMRQIDAPQLREAMKRMNEAMKMMSPEQIKQAMENFRFNEDAFRRSIDRTLDLLKRIQIEQKVDELARRSDDMAKRQEDLANRTQNADPKNQAELDRLANEQKQLSQDAEAMQRELKNLQNMMQEFPKDMPLDALQDAMSELNLSQMQQEMSESSGQCQGGQCQSASKGQKKSADRLRKFQQKMQSLKQKLNENQQRIVQQAFKRALDNVLTLSKRQEQLKNETASLPPNSQQFREMMQRQMQTMEELNRTANDLMDLSKKSFDVTPQMAQHLGEAMKNMRQAMENMQNRNNRSSAEQQGAAMAELNEAAKKIAEGMKSSKSGNKQGGSMMQQLMQMAQAQMSVNQGTQQMMDNRAMQQLAQMQRLAQQQAALQKTLQELNDEAKRSAEGRRLLGDLNRIADDMQEVVRDMQQGEIDPNTIQKQERILSRLLDASKSMRERDWEKKRRSETGIDVVRRSPANIDPSLLNPESGVKSGLQRAMEEGYNRDYESLIRKYFDAVEKVIGEKRD